MLKYIWSPDHFFESALSEAINKPLFKDFVFCKDINQIPPDAVKVAFMRYEVIPYINLSLDVSGIVSQPNCLTTDLGQFDLIITFTSEAMHESCKDIHNRIAQATNNNNVISLFGGHPLWLSNLESTFFSPLLTFFLKVVVYNSIDQTDLKSKPYLFDALLGMTKPHRTYVQCKLVESNLIEKTLLSVHTNPTAYQTESFECLFPELHDKFLSSQSNFFENYQSPALDDLETPTIKSFKQQATNPLERCSINLVPCVSDQYLGLSSRVEMSCVVPWKIYQHSWYSIVTESTWAHFLFLTEKTAKCLLAKRIFILFAGNGSLKFLHQLGFKTFHGRYIDESYDCVLDPVLRLKMAWTQVERLATYDPVEVYDYYQEIVEHNQRVMLELPETHLTSLRDFINLHTQSLSNA